MKKAAVVESKMADQNDKCKMADQNDQFKMADQNGVLCKEPMTNGEMLDIILAYDEGQNMAHSMTRSGEIGPKDMPRPKNKARKTWNTKKLKQISAQLLKPFATISANSKGNRAPLSNLSESFSR
jgi:hypothetical protein